MQRSHRQKAIIRALGSEPVETVDLARLTGVSAVTIRRDLADLEGEGLLRRVHGGAVAVDLRGTPMPYSLRAGEHAQAKMAIAGVVAGLVQDNMSLVLDNGSTMVAVAEVLAGRPVTAMCLSLRAASALSSRVDERGRTSTTIVTPGGVVAGGSLRYEGASCLQALEGFRGDMAIVGACSASPVQGLSTTTSEDAQVKRMIVDSCIQVVVAITGDKLQRTSSFRFGSLEQIDHLVTTSDAPRPALDEIRAAGVTVHLAA